MAKNRMVSTGFWSDHYIADLDPTEKLLFLYLLTCEKSTLCGIYELPKKVMAVETGIETEMVGKILGRFENDGKVKYQSGWVAIKNFTKHHEHGSPLIRKGIDDAIAAAPEWARSFIGKGIDTLSPSASASASSSATRVEIVEDTEKEERSKSKPKYPHAREVSSWFPEPEPSWLINTTELQHMELLWIRGEKAVRGILSFVSKHKDTEFFPKGNKPSSLERNWTDIQDFAKRNGL